MLLSCFGRRVAYTSDMLSSCVSGASQLSRRPRQQLLKLSQLADRAVSGFPLQPCESGQGVCNLSAALRCIRTRPCWQLLLPHTQATPRTPGYGVQPQADVELISLGCGYLDQAPSQTVAVMKGSLIQRRAPAPSPMTKPSRPLSQGREAASGALLCLDRALQAMKPPMPEGMMAASDPPASMMSASPLLMCSAALHQHSMLSVAWLDLPCLDWLGRLPCLGAVQAEEMPAAAGRVTLGRMHQMSSHRVSAPWPSKLLKDHV